MSQSSSSSSASGGGSLAPDSFFNLLDNAFVVDSDLLLSVVVRTVIVSLFVFLAIRWIGRKGLAQLSTYELIILIGLGSAIGDPMIYMDLSLVQAFAAIVIVIAVFKLIDISIIKSRKFQNFAESDPILLAKDGKYVEEGLSRARVSKEEFQGSMRLKGIWNVSQISESYLESNGQISFLQMKEKNKTAAAG